MLSLNYLSTNIDLRSLTTLVLDLNPGGTEDTWPHEFTDATSCLFRSLSALRAIRLIDELGLLTLDTMLAHHGRTLYRMHLSPPAYSCIANPFVTVEATLAIVQACPLLGDLLLSIPRSRGGVQETSYYRALGQLPRLQTLTLFLDCSNLPAMYNNGVDEIPDGPSFNEENEKFFEWSDGIVYPREQLMQDSIINSAIDESLAKAIFQLISRSKMPGGLPLESLKLHVTGVERYTAWGLDGLSNLISVLERSWFCMLCLQNEGQNRVFIEEINKRQREQTERLAETLDDDMKAFFRGIWPEGEAEKWWRDWRSWPLVVE